MIEHLLRFSLSQRLLVIVMTLVMAGFGARAFLNLPIDAFPDVSPVQVKLILKAEGMTPTDVEMQITTPIEQELRGIPGQSVLRSVSKYGLADITIDFDEGTDIYWARQQVNERLNAIRNDLPANMQGGLAPITTPLGEVLMFTLESPTLSLEERREILDWVIRPRLRSIDGVADVNSLGGKVRTYRITPDMEALARYGITLDELIHVLESNHVSDGLGRLKGGEELYLVRYDNRAKSLDDLRTMIIRQESSRTLRIGDVAQVDFGDLKRNGFVTKDGKDETVQGLILSMRGADASHIVDSVKAELDAMKSSLPKDLDITIFYDRSNLIQKAVATVESALMEATIIVIILLLLFLANIRSALSVAVILPLAVLGAFILMAYFGLSANIMSLGGLAIAIGLLVDSAVVMVENITEHLQDPRCGRENLVTGVFHAAKEVALPIISGVSIIMIVFLPLLTLQGLEGKLFAPVALTIIFALLASLILTLTAIPALATYLLKPGQSAQGRMTLWLERHYEPSLKWALHHPKAVISAVGVALLFAIVGFMNVGKTFMPTMDEGNIIIGIEKVPSISLEESRDLDLLIQSALIRKVPEITSIIARTGTDEIGLDPMGLNDSDTFLVLKPKTEWREPDVEWLKEEIRKVLRTFGGIGYGFTQPIDMRVSEMLSGVRGDVAIKIFGEETEKINDIAKRIESLLPQIEGSKDIYRKQNEGVSYIELDFNHAMIARAGLDINLLTKLIALHLQGIVIGDIKEGLKRIPLVIQGEATHSISQMKEMSITLSNNRQIPLSSLVEFKRTSGAVMIEHENGMRLSIVQTNVEGRDMSGFVQEAKALFEEKLELPAGYFIDWGGQFENQERAFQRLMIVVPIALALIFFLLFMTFGSLRQTALVLTNIPFALIGGILGLFLSGLYLSVPASVGFIALLGIAVLNGVVLVNYFNQLREEGLDAYDVVIKGAMRRMRPVLMTAGAAALGLVPLLFATGPGSEIQHPLAVVVISGLVSSTLLTLILLPLLYFYVEMKGKLDS